MRNIPRLESTQGHAVLITAVPLGQGQFEARCDGEVIVARTRAPLLDSARALLAAGYDPDTVAVMRHTGSDIDALTARIGTAARFYVEESAHGPVLRAVRKASPGAVDRAPIAQTREAPPQIGSASPSPSKGLTKAARRFNGNRENPDAEGAGALQRLPPSRGGHARPFGRLSVL